MGQPMTNSQRQTAHQHRQMLVRLHPEAVRAARSQAPIEYTYACKHA